MLLKNQKEDTTDYTKDWPARYYDIPTGRTAARTP